jgi:hypothetical protein
MKVYELKMQEGGKGVFRVSVVKDPAVESTLLYFKSEDVKEVDTYADQEKKIIYSIAMRPEIRIPRKDVNGEPAKVFFSKDTVEQLAINYFRQNGNKETSINHSDVSLAQGIFPFESWTVRDAARDKSTVLGMDTKEGDWVMGYKVDNKEIWDDFIKTGKLDGLSIECTNMSYEFKNEIPMTKPQEKEKSLIDKMMDFLFTMKAETEKDSDTDTPEVELGKDKIKAAEEVIEKKEDEPAKSADEPKKEEPVKAAEEPVVAVEKPAEVKPTEKEQLLMDEIAQLKQTISVLEADKIKAETSLQTMSKQTPAATKIKNAPTPEVSVAYEKMTKFQQLKFNREHRN